MEQPSRRNWLSLASFLALAGVAPSSVSQAAKVGRSNDRTKSPFAPYVTDFGATGDGVNDDSKAFQNAVDAAPPYGGRILIPPGRYLIGGVECGLKAIEWSGDGGPGQSDRLGHGSTELIVRNGTVGITFGDGRTNLFRGPVLRNIRVSAQSAAAHGGLLFRAVSTAVATNVVCSNFLGEGHYGWKFDGSGVGEKFPTTTMYNDLYGCGANNCTIGILGTRASDLRVFGGTFDANDNYADAIRPGSTGIKWEAPGGTIGIFGGRFQSYETHIDSMCDGAFISGTRHEGFLIGIRIGGSYSTVMPGEMDNSIARGIGTAVCLVSGMQAFVVGNAITAVSTRIDRGKAENYTIIDSGAIESNFKDGRGGLLLGGDVNLYRPSGVHGALRTDGQFRAGDGTTTKIVPGKVADESFRAAPPDGMIAIDAVHNRLYVRINGAWHFSNLVIE